jgi:hypothetical protein
MNKDNNIGKNDNDKPNEFQEPAATYHRPRIRFFDSYEGQREEMYVYLASLSPVQRMANLLELIIKTYGLTPENMKNHRWDKKIKIIRYDEFSS